MARAHKPKSKITAEHLRDVWKYDPDTGVVTWAKKTCRKVIAGRPVGSPHNGGYLHTSQMGEVHLLHRLIWLWVYGEWPPSHIDHVNGDRRDNRLINLRLADPSQNTANQKQRADNTSGVRGVCWSNHRKAWIAQIQWRGRHRYLGQYASLEAASEAYRSAAAKMFGEFVRQEAESRDA